MATKPILILPEGATRLVGRDARRMNVAAAKIVAEAVRTTLGPRGMDKMMVDTLGDVTVTNDGVTILKEMDVEHPAAKMMVEVAKTMDEEVKDGTTTAVVVAGALLHQAEKLLDQGIHPMIIVTGYRMAADKAREILEELAEKTSIEDDQTLKKIAMTSMTGKKSEGAREKLAELAVEAIRKVADKVDGKYRVDLDHVGIEKKAGGSMEDSQIVNGLILDKERVHPGMPEVVKNAKIALLDLPLEIKKTETDAEIRVTRPEQLRAFLDQEEKMLKEMVDKIASVGANVVFCQKGIDDLAQHYLAKAKILAARRVKKSDMEKLSRATGGKIVTSLEDLTPAELGRAGVVEERKIGDKKFIFVRDCENPKAVGILVRGGSEHVTDEIERGLTDALGVVAAAVEDNRYVYGGGAPEMALATRLRDYADTVGGREALAIKAFADALEIIPKTLAENAGMDSVDILVELRARHSKPDGKYYGVDVYSGKIEDMRKLGVCEPLRVKTQAIKSAAEAAIMILRIDDVIAAAKKSFPSPKTPGGEGGEGEKSETESD
ncbi:MAG: thermosome subunit [Hadesarchaea archaeon]|nr:MAG: thermosome subunit [Hadesarchaea archaeon]